MEQKKNYVFGILGGLLGGFIAAIPWVLVYVYGNMLFSALAIIIALGVLKGYEICKGKLDSKLPLIIIVLSVIVVTISTFVIIPALLLSQNGAAINSANFQKLYAYSKFSGAILKDYTISLIFTFFGISGVVTNIKKQVANGEVQKIDFNLNNSNINLNTQKSINEIKNIFQKHDALNKENAIEKHIIIEELSDQNAKSVFKTLCIQQIILKYHGKYYFSEQNEKSAGKRFTSLFGKIILYIFIIILVGIILMVI